MSKTTKKAEAAPDEIVARLKRIETAATTLNGIPPSEQHIRSIQAVVAGALLEIKGCLEALAGRD